MGTFLTSYKGTFSKSRDSAADGLSRLVRNVPFLDSLEMSPFQVVGTVRLGVAAVRFPAPREWAI